MLWAAEVHEIGFSIGYSGYHKHGSYILENAEMPGFSNSEQKKLASYVLSHRRSLDKTFAIADNILNWHLVVALRLSILFYRKRRLLRKPTMELSQKGKTATLTIEKDWLSRNPLTRLALEEETANWSYVGINLTIKTKK